MFGEEGALLSSEEIAERECAACLYLRGLYFDFADITFDSQTGKSADPSFIDTVFQVMADEQYVEFFKVRPDELTLLEWESIRIVRAERSRRDKQIQLQSKVSSPPPSL